MKLPRISSKQWACLGGVALMTGVWMAPGVPQTHPETVPVTPPTAKEQVVEPPNTAVQPSQQAIKKYTVVAGDTLSGIAQKHGIDLDTLLAANPGISDLIHPGDELDIIPNNDNNDKGFIYQVIAGDTLWDIAHTYGIQVEELKAANSKNDDHLAVGEKIYIPGARWARAETAVARASVSRFIWPTRGEISSPFGWRWGRLHAGLDLANDIGTHVMAARAGRVIWAGWRGGYGYTVMIDHGSGYVSLYGHLDDYFVERGQYVRAGQRIASMGNTGNSTGPHLHFEIRKDGQAVDPMGLLP